MPLGSGNGNWKVVDPPPFVTTTGPAPVLPPLPVLVAGLLPVGGRPLTGVVGVVAVLVASGPSGLRISVVGVVVGSSPASGRGGATVRWRSAAR